MLYISRSRYKESVTAADMATHNRIIDTAIIPAFEKVEGVRSAQGYTSISGEATFILDIQDLATMDRIMVDPGVRAATAQIYDAVIRTGGEILYERPQWQGVYGKS